MKKSEEFKKTIKSNTLFINDDYFKSEVLRKNGEIRKGHYDKINCNNNQELNDFYQLIKLIKATKCKASFIIQGLNPYHYLSLENFNPTLNKICSTLKKEKIPFLNQFTTKKQNYIPGTLNDIMHIGDIGWLQIDKFLIETYGY